MLRKALFSGLMAALIGTPAFAANDPLETVEVTASREQVRDEAQSFVSKVTRLDGELVAPLEHGHTDLSAGRGRR